MHSINSRARRIAWERNQGATSSFNPFRRARPRRPTTDYESGPSLATYGDPIEARRRSSSRLPQHAETWPELEGARPAAEADDDPSAVWGQAPASQPSIVEVQEAESVIVTPLQRLDAAENVELAISVKHARKRPSLLGTLLSPIFATFASAGGAFHYISFGKTKKRIHLRYQLRKIFLNSWAHVLLLLIPAGIAVHYARVNPVAVFFINFAAMIPSIMVMALAVENILLFFGELVGGLISTTFSNAGQLITSVLLLRSRQLGVLRTSLVGAILSNLLLMPGLGFLFGGLNRTEQNFNVTVAQTTSEMLLLAVLSLMIPTAGRVLANIPDDGIVKQSRGTAIILLLCYGLYLFFQLKTHVDMYNEPSRKVEKRKASKKAGEASRGIAAVGAMSAVGGRDVHDAMDDGDEVEEPELTLVMAFMTLAIFTALLTFNTLFATDSINALLERLDISETFLGIVILPTISNDPTTIIVAVKDHQDLMIGLTLGRCVQTALLLIPFIVLLAWMMGIDGMTLSFNSFETLVMLVSVLVVNYIIQDGKSFWLVGALLVAAYLIVSVSAFYIP